jgi:prevent-host-death family protein
MTSSRSKTAALGKTGLKGIWRLQDAKARFSEVVRQARSEGPQHITVHGREEAVIISAEEFHRLNGQPTGAALVAALQKCPYPDIDLKISGVRSPVNPPVTF